MQKKPRLKAHALCAGLLCSAAAQFALAQAAGGDATPKPSVSVVPRVSVSETWTDNASLNSARQSEQITELSPGLHVDVNKAQLKGFFDYAVSAMTYAQSSAPSRSTNALASNFKLEAVENTFFVDTSGSISQQAISAFGTQSVDNTSVNANRTEVSTYRISPYLQGRLGGVANYVTRYGRSVTSGAGTGDVATTDMSLALNGGHGQQALGWTANAIHQDVSYSAGRPTDNDTLSLGLTYALTPQLNLSAEAGSESNNFSSLDRQTHELTGMGLTWSPLESTRLASSTRHHSYGDTFQVSFDHRTGRTVWHFSDTRDVTQSPNQQGITSLGTVYDLYYAQFATIEPDPVARAQLVNAFLQTYGIAPGSIVLGGFSASSLSLQRRQELSFALLGQRDTLTFIATQSESQRLDIVTTVLDDFSTASVVRQQGQSVNWAHRLTPDYALSLLLSQVATSGSLAAQANTLRSVNLSLSGKLGLRSTLTLGLRHVESESSLVPYSETAVTGAFNLRF